MSDAARLAKQAFGAKPNGASYVNFSVPPQALQSIIQTLPVAIVDSAYASLVSYAEAILGIHQGSSSWSIVRLYYSAFYSLKTMMLMHSIIPFNGGKEMLLDGSTGMFYAGGRSSHHWNWNSVRKTALKNEWFTSQDSQDAYERLRRHRENVNYTHAFTDPDLHKCLVVGNLNLDKRLRSYRDDDIFTYTYLFDHLAIAYPTKLIFEMDLRITNLGYKLEDERLRHVRSLWRMRDRCPLT